MQLTETNTT